MNLPFSTNKSNIFLGLYVIFTIVFLNALGPYLKLQYIATTILIPSLTVLAFSQDARTFHKNNTEFLVLLSIFIFSFISAFYYTNYEALIKGYSAFFGAVLAAYISVALNKRKDYSDYIHIGYIVSILLLIIIMYLNGNFTFTSFATKIDYRNRFLLNANQYSYYSFFANFSLLYLHQKYKSIFWTVLLICLPILFIIISFATQSRSGLLLIILINLYYWFFINKAQKVNALAKVLKSVLVLMAFLVMAIQFIIVYQSSNIKNRVDSLESKQDSRELLVIESIKVFEDYPFFGVGLNQLPFHNGIGQFSHNSYVEIIAEQGIFGGILLLLLFGIPLKRCWKSLKNDPKNVFLKINLLFFVTFYLFNNAYPFYKFPFSMMYFFLIISVQNKSNDSEKDKYNIPKTNI